MLYRNDSTPICLENLYKGCAAFLVCGGPSLLTHDLGQFARCGILTMVVNNAAAVVRPQLWTMVDDPGNFCDGIWRDPAIIKFAPREHFDKPLVVRDAAGELAVSGDLVRDMPGVFGYDRNEDFAAERFLTEPTFNWGNHGTRLDWRSASGALRSVMYVALKLLHHIGFRRVYLVGCDFRMKQGEANYAFEQDRTKSSVKGNNRSYDVLNSRLKLLRPKFEQAGFEVFNCTPASGLTVFPHVPFERAIEEGAEGFPARLETAGMYDRQQRERNKAAEQVRDRHTTPFAGGSERATDKSLRARRRDARARPRLEIVSHCWHYTRLLGYQLSSLVCHPPKAVEVVMTVFYSETDAADGRDAAVLRRAAGRKRALELAAARRTAALPPCDRSQSGRAGNASRLDMVLGLRLPLR